MNLPEIPYPFYGAQITDVSIGPRQEITLAIELWPQVGDRLQDIFRQGDGLKISVHFGGIHDFEAVKSFWTKWQANPNHPGLHYLRYAQDKPSKPGSLFFEIEFDSTGDYLALHCRHITITPLDGD